MSVSLTGVIAADTPSTKGRAGLYNPTPVEKAPLTATETNSLYAPLRANPTGSGAPRPDEGIGTEVPVGDMPSVVLFLTAAAYLGFVFVRKQRELRVKN